MRGSLFLFQGGVLLPRPWAYGFGFSKPRLAVPKPRLGDPKPRLGVPKPRFGNPKPGLGGLGTPSPGLGSPSLDLGSPSLGLGTPSLGLGTRNEKLPYISFSFHSNQLKRCLRSHGIRTIELS